VTPILSHWESFYVIVGSSAAALTGLQFVVIALIAESPLRGPTSMRSIAAFGSPNVVHFGAVLFISAVISAPWNGIGAVTTTMIATGIAGTIYAIVVTRRAHRQEAYTPVLEDWIWHSALPFLAYASILAAALLLPTHSREALFGIGGASLLLLFIGIHNAWDTVTYVAAGPNSQGPNERGPEPPAAG